MRETINFDLTQRDEIFKMNLYKRYKCLLPNISKSFENYIPEDSKFKLIDELCDLLKPLKDLTVLLSGSEYCTINFLYPSLYNLINNIYPAMTFNCFEIFNLREELIKNLRGRFKYLF